MSDCDYPVVGVPVEPRKLTIPRARSVARFAETASNPYVRLLKCYGCRGDGTEAVALAISATVPQRPANDIRHTEPVLIVFREGDDRYPWVESLRKDFPRTPHTNLTSPGEPRSLCLYNEPWGGCEDHSHRAEVDCANHVVAGGHRLLALCMAMTSLLSPCCSIRSWDLIIPSDLLSGSVPDEL